MSALQGISVLLMDVHSAKTLEFDKIKGFVLNLVATSLGARETAEIHPAGDRQEVGARLALCTEFLSAHCEGYRAPFHEENPDLLPIMVEVRTQGARLNGKQLQAVRWLCKVSSVIRRSFQDETGKRPALSRLSRSIPELADLGVRIAHCVDPSGSVLDDASPALGRIRAQIRVLRERIQRVLEAILRTSAAIQEEVIVQREGRHVILVRAGAQGSIPGIVHGQSSSGASVFVEPLTVVDSNNSLRLLFDEESEEVARILDELTETVRDSLPLIREAGRVVGKVDLLCAYAKMADALHATVPSINESGTLEMIQARHPLLCFARGNDTDGLTPARRIIPSDLRLDDATRMLVVSGPNAGGKTVLLKTVGLLSMMLQSGMPIPVHPDSSFPVFRSILADIGDQQDLSADLSTFSAHLKTIQAIVEEHEEPALILLDELGGSTDPAEGSALGIALADYFLKRDVLAVVTTHSETLKVFAATTPGVQNAAMEFDDGPTYRLIMGIPGSSNALSIAESLGFPESILKRAKQLRGETELMVGRYLMDLQKKLGEMEQTKADLEDRLSEADKARAAYQASRQALDAARKHELVALRRDKEKEIEELFAGIRRLSSELLQTIEAQGERSRLKELVRKRLRRLEQNVQADMDEAFPQPPQATGRPGSPGEIGPGVRVKVFGLGIEGEVMDAARQDGELEILAGGKKVLARTEQVQIIGPSGTGRNPQVRLEFNTDAREDVPLEINLIGCTTDEALERVDKFLDDAILAKISRVRLIHGHGTGRLRTAIRSWLNRHPSIVTYGEAHQTEGGSGATLVTLDV